MLSLHGICIGAGTLRVKQYRFAAGAHARPRLGYACAMLGDAGAVVTLVAITLPLIALWVVAYWDLTRRDDLGNTKKVLWGLAMFVLSYIGILAYAIARPAPQPAGKAADATVPESSRKVAALEELVGAHRDGTLPDAEFEAEKRRILVPDDR